jgi:hypothetical protein
MTVKNIYPWGDFLIDDATGLPAIPENHFWRVTRVAFGFWEVQLRERRKFWFSKKLGSRIREVTETPIHEKWILDGAAHALSNYYKRDTRGSNRSLLGDYPPKKLES